MNIDTKRLHIRPFTMNDANDMHALFTLIEVMQPLGMAPAHTSMDETKERLNRWISSGIHHAIALRERKDDVESERAIGYIVIKPDSEDKREDTRELGFALHPGWQHRGYMTETVDAVLAYLQKQGIRYVWACCFEQNLSSKSLIERCGFSFQQKGSFFAEGEGITYPSLEYCMELTCNRGIKIERVTMADAEELLSIYAPYVRDTAISFEYAVPSLDEFQKRIESISSCLPFIKAVQGGEILGYAYAGKFKERKAYDWSVEVTVYVRRDVRRKGVGSLLYGALEKSLRQMGILNMNACIAVPKGEDPHLTNDSYHFHSRMGFDLVGTFHNSGYKFDTWYDMIWMEKIIGAHTNQQEPVKYGAWTID